MFGSEENINPHDVYLFSLPEVSNMYTQAVQDYCSYEMDCASYNLLSSILFDKDYTYYENIHDNTLEATLMSDVNDAISRLADSGDDSYYEMLISDCGGEPQNLGQALYNHLYHFHHTFLQHIPTMINMATLKNEVYVDFNISDDVDKMVVRFKRGRYGRI